MADEDALLSLDDAARIGFKVVEMADRAAAIDPACPGVEAKWKFTIDDRDFDVVVRLSTPES